MGEGNAAADQTKTKEPSAAQSEHRGRSSKSANEHERNDRSSARKEQNNKNADRHRAEERNRNEADRDHARDRRNDEAGRNRSSHENNRAAERPNTRHQRTASHAKHAERLSASLKSSQKTRLASAVSRIDVRPVTNVNFSVSVGRIVPTTVVLHPVPEAIVDIIPEYRDYEFFVVRDEIVIVQPRTHRIVDVIERGGPARAEVTTTTTTRKVRLSDHQRDLIRRDVPRGRITTGAGTETRIIVGEELPESVEVQSFPEEIYEEVPTIRSYRYIERGPNVYLVDPDSRRVIEEIE
ncbi:MAG TPA: DUF1236 domain-containing protein [Pseudolabrys sp.]|nr:DUF1236 domain-containing protein [Pseudolabrys sp.]